jgi:hypothetical protein
MKGRQQVERKGIVSPTCRWWKSDDQEQMLQPTTQIFGVEGAMGGIEQNSNQEDQNESNGDDPKPGLDNSKSENGYRSDDQ